MKKLLFCCALFAACCITSISCRTDWRCNCMMVDSAGHPTSTYWVDYGTISYSKAQDKCNQGNQVWDTCQLEGLK